MKNKSNVKPIKVIFMGKVSGFLPSSFNRSKEVRSIIPFVVTLLRSGKILGVLLLSLSIAFCGGRGKKSSNGDDPNGKPINGGPTPVEPNVNDKDGDGILNNDDGCPEGTMGAATTSDPTAPTADPDMDGCKNSEDDDDDGDGINDTLDAFDYDECASADSDMDGYPDNVVIGCITTLTADVCPNNMPGPATTDDPNADTADPDMDGCKNKEDTDDDGDGENDLTDVDDDNDGLIEIANSIQFNNIRFDLAGNSYDIEETDTAGNEGSIAGAPTSATRFCKTATRDVYLCGYELIIDIDFGGEDGDPGTTPDNIDLNGRTAGNINPIASGSFTAIFEGNGHTIRNLNIDISGTPVGNNEANNAALFISCQNTSITNLTLEDPVIQGRRRIGVLCSTMQDTTVRNVRIVGGTVQGDSSVTTFGVSMGGLAGEIADSIIVAGHSSADVSVGGSRSDIIGGLVGKIIESQIVASHSSGNVKGGGAGGDSMGGLVGEVSTPTGITATTATDSIIAASHSSGDVSDGGDGVDIMGGLVGQVSDSIIVAGHSSGNVKGGGAGADIMGGLVGDVFDSIIVAAQSSGDVSDGGAGVDAMGGLIGIDTGNILLRDSYTSSRVCAGVLTTTCAADGSSEDNVGALIGEAYGIDPPDLDPSTVEDASEIHNCLAVGETTGDVNDTIGLLGIISEAEAAVESEINAAITDNYFDTDTTGLDAINGRAGDANEIMNSNLTGITGATTNTLQTATPYSTNWLATRWLFEASVYPSPLYFDFDQDNDLNTTDDFIDVCETVAGNDPKVDEGEFSRPDCGDILDAWPRQTAVFNPVPTDLMLMEGQDGSGTAIDIGSPVTAYDNNRDTITYSLKSGAPTGYVIDSVTGQISYEGTGENYDMHMSRDLIVIATSLGASGSATQVEQMVTIMIVDVP